MEDLSDDSTKEHSDISRISTHNNSPQEVTRQQVEAAAFDKGVSDKLHLIWDSDDKSHPRNWSKGRKWLITGIALLGTLLLPLNGTSITVATEEINAEYGISDAAFPNSYWPVTSWSLGGAVFIILFLPLMEDLGVRLGYMASYVVFYAMLIGQARAQSFATLIVTRFFSGGCVALQANTISSMIPDVWATDEQRSLPVAIYIILYIAGSTLGPVIFAPIMEYVHDWRWIFYAQLIL